MTHFDFITLFGGAVTTWPLWAHAQQPKVSRLGWLTTASAADVSPFLVALRAGLAAQGYVEGRNLTVLSNSTLRLSGKRLGIKRLPLDLKVGPLETGIVVLKNRNLSATVKAFIECARDVAKPFAWSAT